MDLRVNGVDEQLMAQLKAKAALAKKTMRQFVIELLRRAVK